MRGCEGMDYELGDLRPYGVRLWFFQGLGEPPTIGMGRG
jgi:hypothetical protein